ncbi:MAG: T9SS type A sorting domain-containing protein, partial [Ignavibacteria bacterium]
IVNVIEINNSNNEIQNNVRVPLWDVFSDGRVFVYDFEFNQIWQSYRSGQPQFAIALGDVDNDGKKEAIFTFCPINDTFPQYKPSHITVFECYGDNQYRIDWDTLMQEGGSVIMPGIYDFDRNGKNEFFAKAHSWWGEYTDGVFECSGPGKYRFMKSGNNIGNWYDMCYLDSTRFSTGYPVDTFQNRRGFLGLYGFQGGTYSIQGFTYFSKDTAFGGRLFSFLDWNYSEIGLHFQVYDIEFGDIDKDGKREILIGDTQYETNFIDYLDSTGGGPSWQAGWEVKTIIPNAPISAGYTVLKDYDNDGYKEITVCGIGIHSGSIGTVKHTGSPGQNQFATVFWDSSGIDAGPNNFIDTGTINNKFVILYPYYWRMNFLDYYYFLTYSRTGLYDLYKSSYKKLDTSSSLRSYLYDMDNDNRISIVSSLRYQSYPSGNSFLTDFESNTTIGINDPIVINIPKIYELFQNYPNPFNPTTKINFSIPKSGFVSLKIYDITGREVKTLLNEIKQAGNYAVDFNGSLLSSGVYFYRIQSGDFVMTKRMVLVK